MACSPDKDLHQMLECSVCLTKYKLPNRCPKNLGCGHTFCMTCLRELVADNKVTCPTCRAESDLPKGGVKGKFLIYLSIMCISSKKACH